jgi:hypothetical protein
MNEKARNKIKKDGGNEGCGCWRTRLEGVKGGM